MIYGVIAFSAILSGLVQTVTGFGSAVILMTVLPYFFPLPVAPTISTSISLGLTTTLAWKYRKYVNFRLVLPPALIYMSVCFFSVNYLKHLDLSFLGILFGIFLILLSLYNLLCKNPITAEKNHNLLMVFCSTFSGITAGLFGIGGPTMAVYFLSVSKKHEEYIGSMQFAFVCVSISSLAARIINGYAKASFLPLIFVGLICITIGKYLGIAATRKLKAARIRSLIYLYVGISGVIMLVNNLS